MEALLWTLIGVLSLGGIAALWWDTAHGMHPGEEPSPSLGDVTAIPADQLHRLHLQRFERMDGVL